MVALCRDHHPEADAGAFTVDQLRELKAAGRDRTLALGAKFNWMRNKLLAVVGGNFYYETPTPIAYAGLPVVWFNRDESGRLLVNLRMLTTSNQPRMLMIDNFWLSAGSDESAIVCPPSGRLVSASYPNGDKLRTEFREVASVDEFDRRYAQTGSHEGSLKQIGVEMPLAVVEITMAVGGTDVTFGPKQSSIKGSTIEGCWISHCGVGLQIDAFTRRRPGVPAPRATEPERPKRPPPPPRKKRANTRKKKRR